MQRLIWAQAASSDTLDKVSQLDFLSRHQGLGIVLVKWIPVKLRSAIKPKGYGLPPLGN